MHRFNWHTDTQNKFLQGHIPWLTDAEAIPQSLVIFSIDGVWMDPFLNHQGCWHWFKGNHLKNTPFIYQHGLPFSCPNFFDFFLDLVLFSQADILDLFRLEFWRTWPILSNMGPALWLFGWADDHLQSSFSFPFRIQWCMGRWKWSHELLGVGGVGRAISLDSQGWEFGF